MDMVGQIILIYQVIQFVTFLSPSWRSLKHNHLKCHVLTTPKRSQRIARVIFVPYAPIPSASGVGRGVGVPKQLLKGYLHKGGVCGMQKITRDFVGKSRFASHFCVGWSAWR